jgi:hypothetical protein
VGIQIVDCIMPLATFNGPRSVPPVNMESNIDVQPQVESALPFETVTEFLRRNIWCQDSKFQSITLFAAQKEGSLPQLESL